MRAEHFYLVPTKSSLFTGHGGGTPKQGEAEDFAPESNILLSWR